MAIFKGNNLSGKISNMVVYEARGKRIARSLAFDVKQSAATKASSKKFGHIKRLSAGLRRGLSVIHPGYVKPGVMYAIDRAVGNWYNYAYPHLDSPDLNSPYFDSLSLSEEHEQTPLIVLGQKPQVDWEQPGKLVINIPGLMASSMKLPPYVQALSFTAVVAAVETERYGREYNHKTGAVELSLQNGKLAATTLEVPVETHKNGHLFLAYLKIRYKNSAGWMEEEEWNPVLVVGSCYR